MSRKDKGFPGGLAAKTPTAVQETQLRSRVGKIPWRRERQPTPVRLPGKSHGQRSLVGYTVHGVVKSQTRLSNQTTTNTTTRIQRKEFWAGLSESFLLGRRFQPERLASARQDGLDGFLHCLCVLESHCFRCCLKQVAGGNQGRAVSLPRLVEGMAVGAVSPRLPRLTQLQTSPAHLCHHCASRLPHMISPVEISTHRVSCEQAVMDVDRTVCISSPPVTFRLQDASSEMTVRTSAWVGQIETNRVALTYTHCVE